MNDKTQDNPAPFPHKPLRDLFKTLGVREGHVGQKDLLVSWKIRSQEVEIRPLTEEIKAQAIDDNSYKTMGKDNEPKPAPRHRHAILRKTGDVSPEFLVSWASIPGNAKRLAVAGSTDSGFYLNAKTRTENMLAAAIPCPTPEQEKQMKSFNDLSASFAQVIENKRKMIDTQEKMLFAVQAQMLSGKINTKQAKEYFRQVMAPDYTAMDAVKQQKEKSKGAKPSP